MKEDQTYFISSRVIRSQPLGPYRYSSPMSFQRKRPLSGRYGRIV